MDQERIYPYTLTGGKLDEFLQRFGSHYLLKIQIPIPRFRLQVDNQCTYGFDSRCYNQYQIPFILEIQPTTLKISIKRFDILNGCFDPLPHEESCQLNRSFGSIHYANKNWFLKQSSTPNWYCLESMEDSTIKTVELNYKSPNIIGLYYNIENELFFGELKKVSCEEFHSRIQSRWQQEQ